MAMFEECSVGRVFFNNSKQQILVGTNVTRATVQAEVDDGINNPAVGSIYLSTDRAYLRVAADGANTDFEKITLGRNRCLRCLMSAACPSASSPPSAACRRRSSAAVLLAACSLNA